MRNLFFFFIFNSLLTLVASSSSPSSSSPSPNLLYIISDDLSDEFSGPNMESLKLDSISFTNAYTTIPVCSPSRCSFLTGLNPDSLKIYTFVEKCSNQTSLPKYLGTKMGYLTASFGKVFHWPYVDGVDIYSTHFTERVKGELGSALAYDEKANSQCPNNLIMCEISETNSADYVVASKAINFIQSKIGSLSPWAAFIGFHSPHLELAVPKKYLGLDYPPMENTTLLTPIIDLNYYECDDLRQKNMFFPGVGIEKIVSNSSKRPYSLNFTYGYPSMVGNFRKYYKGAVNNMDAQMGRILTFLKQIPGLYNNTIIVFHSDHGWNSGRYGMWCKNSLFDGATKVPLYIKKAGNKVEGENIYIQPTQLIDVFPTVIELIKGGKGEGIKIKEELKLDGVSRISTSPIPSFSFSQYPRCQSPTIIQTDACVWSTFNICNTLPLIQFMGYSVRYLDPLSNCLFTQIIWKPFVEKRLGCGLVYPGTQSLFPLIDGNGSRTVWEGPTLNPVLLKNEIRIDDPILTIYLTQVIVKHFSFTFGS